MSGGLAFVYDFDGRLPRLCNEDVAGDLCPLDAARDEPLLVSLLQRHVKHTGSTVARAILADWQAAKSRFVKVFPHEYRRAMAEFAEMRTMDIWYARLSEDELMANISSTATTTKGTCCTSRGITSTTRWGTHCHI